ncbi:MAG: hypothetical protein O7E57_09690, partial [Gammaproteobacteria bacterium]|nr:hypothetical protein [Gammaproteobacteria bacterium]
MTEDLTTARAPPTLRVAELITLGRTLPVPFLLHLVDEGGSPIELRCREVLRLLPGRRLVALCIQEGEPRILKLFMGSSATRYRNRERAGVLALARCGVPTPALLGAPEDPAGVGGGLLFEYLDGAHPVAEGDGEAIDQIAALLGKLHTSGVWHGDLHLDNFVKDSTGKVHAIDGDGIRGLRKHGHRPLSERASLENLALLLAQLPPLADARLQAPLESYDAARGCSALPLARMGAMTRWHRRLRARHY